MGFLDAILGRSRPKAPQLDALFAVPNAALAIEASMGLRSTGVGSVCYRAATGAGFEQAQREVVDLLAASSSAPDVDVSTDGFGFTWLNVTHDGDDTGGLCTDLHAVNTTLEEAGFGPGLLCSLVVFAGAGQRLGLVYLYKQGTFYPFVPTGPQERDNLFELQARNALEGELPLEPDMGRWMAVWGAPGL